jgi:uncharacterized membrane protein YdjX (TVP38/TMEM64 family)
VKRRIAAVGVLALAAWAVWSYQTGGLLRVLIATPAAGLSRLDALRAYVESWGALAPVVYIAAVTVEVLVAPIPGTLLYAPAGAIFGGLVGGTLSLAGNVLGAAIACWIAGSFGERWRAPQKQTSSLARYQERLASRGAWIVFLLRVNPFTSSDLVSYAAGLAGVRPHQVALGTVFGMAPLCYAQAYLAQSLFEWLSPRVLVSVGAGLIVALVAVVVWKRRRRR